MIRWRSYGLLSGFYRCRALSPILFKDQILMNQAMVHTSSTMNMLGVISILIITIMTMAIIISTAINIALNYRNSMFKRPGYLTLTLPVTTHQLILSKVLADILWILIAGFVLMLGYTLMVLVAGILVGMNLPSWSDWMQLFSQLHIDLSDLVRVFLSLALIFSGMAEIILYVYLVITLPQTKFTPRHKTAISVTLFFAISIAMGMIRDSFFGPMNQLFQGLSTNGVIAVEILITLAVCALFYGVIYFILEKEIRSGINRKRFSWFNHGNLFLRSILLPADSFS